MLELGKHVSRSYANAGDGFGRNDDAPHRSWRFRNGVEDSLVEELGVRKEQGCSPTKQYQARNATRRRIARDIVIAPNTIDPAKHRVVWPPPVPQELEESDHYRDANTWDYSEHGNAYKANHRQPEFPLLNPKNATQICEFEQADGCGKHNRGKRAARQILQQVGCEHQKERDCNRADHSGELRLRPGRFCDGSA